MQTQQTVFWLKAASGFVIGFGVLMLTGTRPAASVITSFLADLVFWPVDGSPVSPTAEGRLLWAISGGILIGWGVLLWRLVSAFYDREPQLVRSMILSSVVSWFLFDCAGSIAAGAPLNALLNVGFLLLFVIPLVRRPQLLQS